MEPTEPVGRGRSLRPSPAPAMSSRSCGRGRRTSRGDPSWVHTRPTASPALLPLFPLRSGHPGRLWTGTSLVAGSCVYWGSSPSSWSGSRIVSSYALGRRETVANPCSWYGAVAGGRAGGSASFGLPTGPSRATPARARTRGRRRRPTVTGTTSPTGLPVDLPSSSESGALGVLGRGRGEGVE